jgi:ParB-like chromosome segregation protein Spo0J
MEGSAEEAVEPAPGLLPPDAEVVQLPVDAVATDRQVRVGGVNRQHVAALAEAPEELPPIVVHRPSMQVVDGAHRLQAARERGAGTIRAVLVDGDDTSVLALSVRLNSQHGLPLTRRDRTAAVDRLLTARPDWSDRRVAALAGVAHSTVASRRRSTGRTRQSNVGRDGRIRPRDAAAGRRRAEQLIRQRPDASVREVARSAGVSPATVIDVRRRGARTAPAPAAAPDPTELLESLLADPSLRYSTSGRTLLRLLSLTLGAQRGTRLLAALPPHSRAALAQLARECAQLWSRTADELTALDRSDPSRARGR